MLSHLLELRRRTIYTLLFFVVLFGLCFYFSEEVFLFLIQPLMMVLPKEDSIIATDVTSPLLTPIKLGADAALLGTIPFILYQFWCFLSPGLYQREKNTFGLAIGLSLFLFLAGALFCFYWVLPYMLGFFAHAVPQSVRYLPDMTQTLDFIIRMLIIFGLCFQVPLVCFILVRIGVAQVETLKKIRPYVIVLAFIVGMLLTPPDVFSQVMLAVPLCLLYELGIVLTKLFI